MLLMRYAKLSQTLPREAWAQDLSC